MICMVFFQVSLLSLIPPSQPRENYWVKLVRQWLDHIELHNPTLAKKLCQLIPAQCPFERDIQLFGRTLFHIPPLCKINPFYEQLMGLRFRALCFLADECGEDISQYC